MEKLMRIDESLKIFEVFLDEKQCRTNIKLLNFYKRHPKVQKVRQTRFS